MLDGIFVAVTLDPIANPQAFKFFQDLEKYFNLSLFMNPLLVGIQFGSVVNALASSQSFSI
jgi:hypothetical protein